MFLYILKNYLTRKFFVMYGRLSNVLIWIGKLIIQLKMPIEYSNIRLLKSYSFAFI